MNFKKDVLLAHIDRALAADRDAYDAKVANYALECTRTADRWWAEIAPLWRALADTITTRLQDAKVPITYEDMPALPGSSRRDPYRLAALVFDPDEGPKPYAPPAELVALRLLIESCADEVINTKTIGAKRILEILA